MQREHLAQPAKGTSSNAISTHMADKIPSAEAQQSSRFCVPHLRDGSQARVLQILDPEAERSCLAAERTGALLVEGHSHVVHLEPLPSITQPRGDVDEADSQR